MKMEQSIPQKIGLRLKKIREAHNISQKELAKILNIAPSNVSKYESGSLEINFETLAKICKYFDVSLDYLFGFTEIKKKEDSKVGDDYIIVSKEAFEKGFTAEQIKMAIEFYGKVMKDMEKNKK
jgi:transcriptional regulator with XRE-family HTH domain